MPGFGPAAEGKAFGVSPPNDEALLFRQKGPKPLTPRLASLQRRDANPAKSGPTRRAHTRAARCSERPSLGPAGRRQINMQACRGKPTDGQKLRGFFLRGHVKVLSVDLIMGSDIEQHNFFSGNSSCQSNTVGMSQADGMQSFQFPFESMQAERGLKRIGFSSSENFGELFFLFGVSSGELGHAPIKIAGRGQRIH